MFGVVWTIFKILGLAPWNKRGAFRYSWWSLLTGYGLLFIAIAHRTYSDAKDQSQAKVRDTWKYSATAQIVGYIDFGTICVASVFCLMMSTVEAKNIFRIVEKFEGLKTFHKIPPRRFRFRNAVLLGVLMTSLVVFDIVAGGIIMCEQLLGAWYLRFFLYGSEVMFSSAVLTLHELFQNANSSLRLSIHPNSKENHILRVLPFVDVIKGYGQLGNRAPHRSPESLRELSAIHWKLCTIGNEINAAFNGQLLALFATCIVRVVTTPYFVFLMVDTNDAISTKAVVANIGWVFVHVLQLCLLVWPCSMATKEAAETSTIIVHNLNKPLLTDARNQMEMFLVQLTNHKLSFTVYMFTIDLTVMTSVGASDYYVFTKFTSMKKGGWSCHYVPSDFDTIPKLPVAPRLITEVTN